MKLKQLDAKRIREKIRTDISFNAQHLIRSDGYWFAGFFEKGFNVNSSAFGLSFRTTHKHVDDIDAFMYVGYVSEAYEIMED